MMPHSLRPLPFLLFLYSVGVSLIKLNNYTAINNNTIAKLLLKY